MEEADPGLLKSGVLRLISEASNAVRTMYDRRLNKITKLNATIFTAKFTNRESIEIQVNPEFTVEEAKALAVKYATVIGSLPICSTKGVKTVWIHKGNNDFWGW